MAVGRESESSGPPRQEGGGASPQDLDLVQGCLAASPGAWEALVGRYAGLLAHVVDRVIYPASNEIPTEVFDAMVATETKVKRYELQVVVDDLTLRVKSANNKKRARITGVMDASSSSFYEEPSSCNYKREKLKPNLPTGCFSSLPTYKP
jgi:hypothetical protein